MGEIPAEKALYVLLGLWVLLMLAYLLGFDSFLTETLRSVTAALVGYLFACLGLQQKSDSALKDAAM